MAAWSWTRVHTGELRSSPHKAHIGAPIRVAPQHSTLHDALGRHQDILSESHRFSWSRCFVSLVSYALLLSDVLRSGIGIRNGSSSSQRLKTLEPDKLLYIPPTPYLATHLTQRNATTTESASFWLYKYDTTSIAMRAVAQHLRLPTWSPCTLYQQRCDESTGLPLHSIFTMIDSLVATLASRNRYGTKTATAATAAPLTHLTLRTESQFQDRLHHYALPWFFERTAKFTHRAIHYQYPIGTAVSTAATVCATFHHPRPYSCGESWTQWRAGEPVLSVWKAMRARLATLAVLYPSHTIDFAILDSAEDYTRGSLTYQGKKSVDIVVLTRVRDCIDAGNCTTVAVDDYRYEAGSMVITLDSWFVVVAALRIVGQAYTWFRALLLISVCTLARHQQLGSRGPLKEITATLRSVFLIPSQVVVYGSSFPIGLYMVAHLTDSPAVYELVSTLFNTLLGRFSWSAPDFLRHCAVSMRTVWILSLLCHLAVMASARCRWSPSQGIPGVPEFLMSFTAAFTIFAQYRSLRLRNVRVLQVHEVVPSLRTHQLRGHTHDSTRSMLSDLFFGSTIDARCLITTALALCCLASLLWLLNRIRATWFPYRITLCSRTLVPYSAGSLWPQSRLVVSWFGSVVERDPLATETCDRVASHAPRISMLTVPSLGTTTNRLPRVLRSSPDKGLVMHTTAASRQVQREMQSLDRRSREIESMVYLVNLAVMTDPISFLQLRIFSGYRVAVYESKLTRRCFLLPYTLRFSDADIPIDWDELELLAVINTKDLEWCDLLRCG